MMTVATVRHCKQVELDELRFDWRVNESRSIKNELEMDIINQSNDQPLQLLQLIGPIKRQDCMTNNISTSRCS